MSLQKVSVLGKQLKSLIKKQKNQLLELNKQIKTQEISIKNITYLKLLSSASKLSRNLEVLEKQSKVLTWYHSRKLIVGFKSKVKLVSVKIGAIVWVDAKNYIDLVGRKVGDVVSVYNSQFLVAGVY